jgi:glycosyltransferase involved in cell wall biosynthesis
MNKKRASVAVIIPCFNSSKTIARAIDSLNKQTVLASEVICIDDCSLDNTIEVIERLCGNYPDLNIKILKNTVNAGPSKSRNFGWDFACSDYIALLDSDNAWHSQKIEIQYNWMLKHPDVYVSGHAPPVTKNHPDSVEPSQPELNFDLNIPSEKLNKSEILKMNPFETSSAMVKRNISYRFDEKRRYCEDYLLWMQIAFDDHDIYRLSALLTFVYQTPNSLSTERWNMRVGDIDNYIRLCKNDKISMSTMLIYIIYSLLKAVLFAGSPRTHILLKKVFRKESTI